MRNLNKFLFLLLLPLVSHSQNPGEFVLRSVFITPPANAGNYQYVEIAGPSSISLANVWFIEIDGKAGSPGNIDLAINLGSYSTGQNGLLLIRNSTAPFSPAPDAPTNVVTYTFNPLLSNQSATFALVINFTGTVGQNVDSNADGVLNKNLPWTGVVSAVGISNGSAGNIIYGTVLTPYLGVNIPSFGSNGYDGFVQFNNQFYGFDVNPNSPPGGIYAVDEAWDTYGRENTFLENGYILSPGNTNAALPVKLLSFNAELVNQNVLLNWSASEINMKGYNVQRSIDAANFSSLSFIAAKNIAGAAQQYSYTDNAVAKVPSLFYRLQMIDKDGTIAYSPVVEVNSSFSSSFGVYPNPVAGNLIVAHPKAMQGAGFTIYSTDGKLIQKISAATNATQTSIDVSKYISGNYFIEYINAGNIQTLHFAKL